MWTDISTFAHIYSHPIIPCYVWSLRAHAGDWGKCPPGEMQKQAFVDGKLHFEVNGDPIVNITGFDEWAQCAAMRGEKNGYYHPSNEAGKFEVKAKADAVDGVAMSFARILSVIVL